MGVSSLSAALMLFLMPFFGRPRAWADTSMPAGKVILLQAQSASSVARRSIARIRDELSADRYHVVVAPSSTSGDPGALIDGKGTHDGTENAEEVLLILFGDPESGQAELCVFQRAAHNTAVRRAVVVEEAERIPEALAKRALELVRATALELSVEAAPAPSQEITRLEVDTHPGVVQAPRPDGAIVAVDMGLGLWSSVEGPPVSVAPVGRLGLRVSDWTWARITAAGLGSRPRVGTEHGSATLSQSLTLVECSILLRRDKRVQPAFSLGAGVLNVAVAGTGDRPFEGREPQSWSAALDGGIGATLALSPSVAVVTELHALLALPHPVIRFADTRVATIGYPSFILSIGLRVMP